MSIINTVDGRDVSTLEAGEQIAVEFQEVHQDLVDQSMSFDEPETVQMTVTEVTDLTIRGVDEDTEYIIPVSSHKKQIRARDSGSERCFHRVVGHRRHVRVVSAGSDGSTPNAGDS